MCRVAGVDPALRAGDGCGTRAAPMAGGAVPAEGIRTSHLRPSAFPAAALRSSSPLSSLFSSSLLLLCSTPAQLPSGRTGRLSSPHHGQRQKAHAVSVVNQREAATCSLSRALDSCLLASREA